MIVTERKQPYSHGRKEKTNEKVFSKEDADGHPKGSNEGG